VTGSDSGTYPIEGLVIVLLSGFGITKLKLTKLRGFSPRANHTDRAAAAGRRS